MKKWIFLSLLSLIIGNIQAQKLTTSLPEALFSNDGKYALIQNYDALNDCSVAAWSLYLNETGEELSIIIPKNDTAYFVSYTIERNYYPYFVSAEGCQLNCRIVNMMPMSQFIHQYGLNIQPLELAYKLQINIDTVTVKNVRPPFTDSLEETQFYFSYYLDSHLLMQDTILTNLDSTVVIVRESLDKMEKMRLYYAPKTNDYWIQSAIYNEDISFKTRYYFQDTIIVTNLKQSVDNEKKFGKIQIQPLY